MKSKQVLSIEQMQHLQELGLDISNASMCYYIEEGWEANYFITLACDIREKGGLIYYYDSFSNKEYILREVIPAYTLQDTIELLPSLIRIKDVDYWLEMGKSNLPDEKDTYYVMYVDFKYNRLVYFGSRESHSLIDEVCEMLCWCIENGHVKTNKSK